MTKSTKKKPTSRKLVRQKVGPLDKRRRKRGLTTAVRTAIDAMMFDRSTRAEACAKAGIAERSLYLALAKPEVAAHWNSQLQVLRAGERAQNLHRLTEIRDQNDNRAAAVKAVQVLEQLDAEAVSRPTGMQTVPGLVIVITNAPAPAVDRPVIDITPSKDDHSA